MKTKNAFRFLTMPMLGLVVMLSVASCNKEKSIDPSASNANKTAVLSSEECDDCCTGVQENEYIEGPERGTAIPTDSVGIPGVWGEVAFPFCDGEDNVNFEGQFNSVIAGANGWNVGYLDSTDFPYSTNLSTLDCGDDIAESIVPTANNEIGSNTYSPGYYEYTSPGGAINFIRLVAVWKCCPAQDSIKMYIVKVTDVQAIPIGFPRPNAFTSRVEFDYVCVKCPLGELSCPETSSSLRTAAKREVFDKVPEGIIKHQ